MPDHSLQAPFKYKFHSGVLSTNALGDPSQLLLSDWEQEIRIVDIALLPAFRGSGLGSQVLAALQARARRAGKPLTIHVETNNPARRLYERLGFVEQADKGVYLLMRWQPDD